jgi:hypothetical protein
MINDFHDYHTEAFRARWEHPAFQSLLQCAIWAWMNDAAATLPTSRQFEGRRYVLDVGQLVTSERYLAEQFRVSRTVIRTFIADLTRVRMMTRVSSHGASVITICELNEKQSQENSVVPVDVTRSLHNKPTKA